MNAVTVSVLKLAVIFGIIIFVMQRKKPLMAAIIAASVGTVFLYQLPWRTALSAIWKGASGAGTIQTLLVFYFITYLQRMMENRNNLSNSRVALNGLFNNRRINASLVPFLLGCLPSASTVLICGPIVRDSVGEYLETEEKAAITSYFRHISESFLPTYTTIFIAIGLTNGAVTVSAFLLGMLPMIIALFAVGYIIYLRRIPKDTGMKADHIKQYYWKLLAESIWPIVLAILLILVFSMPVYIAVLICIIIDIFVNHFIVSELKSFFQTAFEWKLLLSTLLIMIFKELLAASGVISILPEFFQNIPIPTFLVYACIFLFGTIVAGSQAMVILCMPMAMESVSPEHALPLFLLLMCMNYAAMQISPVHICLTLCAEDYHIPLGTLISKTMPMIILFIAAAFVYYGFLTALSV
ncbi:MAG: DUF401 family protein [Erysipelotrichia bacterium]|nr:DUF401 family protein [Erysipelotrichia bacterium]